MTVMKQRITLLLLTVSLILGCSAKLGSVDFIREISFYQGNIRLDNNLIPKCYSSKVIYGDYIKGKAEFEYCFYVYPEENEPTRIKTTSSNISKLQTEENFFYKEGKLVYAEKAFKNENDKMTLIQVYLRDSIILYPVKKRTNEHNKLVANGNAIIDDYDPNW